tara:strand:- start:314 stop:487 length:174 start_codon:yes stop_codon:yes gene_type:complete
MPSYSQSLRDVLELMERRYVEDLAYLEWLEETHRHLYPDDDIYTAYEKATGIFAEEE